VIPVDTLLLLSDGAYSDYQVRGLFRVLKAFDMAAWADEHRATFKRDPETPWINAPTPDSFVGWLAQSGLIADEPHTEHHLGAYGELSL
jgi:hypothetical protein